MQVSHVSHCDCFIWIGSPKQMNPTGFRDPDINGFSRILQFSFWHQHIIFIKCSCWWMKLIQFKFLFFQNIVMIYGMMGQKANPHRVAMSGTYEKLFATSKKWFVNWIQWIMFIRWLTISSWKINCKNEEAWFLELGWNRQFRVFQAILAANRDGIPPPELEHWQ